MGMYAYGRTLRREGELRLLALPAGADCEWYCVCNGPTPLATFKLLERAHSFFDAVCGAGPAAVACGGRPQGCPSAAGGRNRCEAKNRTSSVIRCGVELTS